MASRPRGCRAILGWNTGIAKSIVVHIFVWVLLAWVCETHVSMSSHLPEHLPIFPRGLYANAGILPTHVTQTTTTNKKKIPRHMWIAAVNATEVGAWPHVEALHTNNTEWTINIWTNEQKDKFMRDNFAGSRVLWAYENINPVMGGAARADIWRYAVLLLYGGVCKYCFDCVKFRLT
jgi:hypothetical protein